MVHILFDTRADRPDVFRMGIEQIAEAAARAPCHDITFGLNQHPTDHSQHANADALVTSNELLLGLGLHQLRQVAPRLRWIHIIGAGIEPLLPLDWLGSGLLLTNNSGVHAEKMRESGMMALLMLNAHLPAIASNQRQARWQQIFSNRIVGKTALIIGVGDMGGAVAAAAKTLGMRVLGVTRRGAPHPDVDEMAPISALDTLLPRADFIVLAAPLTPATHHLMDARRLALLRPGAGLFNVGRAGLLDYAALAASLADEHLSGAILDVFEPEPLPAESPLWGVKNLLITPHVTSDDAVEYLPKTYDLVFANARRLLQGEAMLNLVDPATGY
jgi:phosphoglycerate dehydrogenase-like enzyme